MMKQKISCLYTNNQLTILMVLLLLCIVQNVNSNMPSFLTKKTNPRVKIIEVKCTPSCVCNHERGLRKATCREKKLVNIKDNIPHTTEILDVSYNYVRQIHNNEFDNFQLDHLNTLNISHNLIGQIGIFALKPLVNLEILDLSHNALQYILPEWFWYFKHLKQVDLNHNNLGALKNIPLFESQTIQILDLSHCQLPHFYESTLSEMPNLQSIDISNNYIIRIDIHTVIHLQHLEEIMLQNNSIKCDNLHDFLDELNIKQINHKSDCMKSPGDFSDVEIVEAHTSSDEKRGKFIVWGDNNDNYLNQNETSWILRDIITDQDVEESECPEINQHYLVKVLETSPVLITSITLGSTYIFGLISACLCAKCRCKRKPPRRQIKSIHRISRSFSYRSGQEQDREYLVDYIS